MTSRLRILIIFSLLLGLSPIRIIAQNKASTNGIIKGKITDSQNHAPVEYATVSVLTGSDGKTVNGAVTDTGGNFMITGLAPGTYKIDLDFLGYRKIEKDSVVVKTGNSIVDMGEIIMTPDQKLLNEVTITSQKDIIENRIDKTIYNVDKDITSQNGVATDVLRKVPQVSVDIDGNVELQGSSSVRFLINGKPSVLFGSNLAEVLQSIPASRIQSIEVITIPGAKYDAAGTGGIINIILKKNKDRGANGNISLSGGTRLENGSINLNMRKKNFGINLFFSGNAQLNSTTVNTTDRTSLDSIYTNHLLEDGTSIFNRRGFESGIGFDWDVGPLTNLEGTVGYNYFGNHLSGSSGRETIINDNPGNTISDIHDALFSTSKFYERSVEPQISLKRKFQKEDEEIEIIYDASFGNNFSYYEQKQENLNPESIVNGSYGNNPGQENENNFELNFTDPLSEKVKLETGAKTELYRIHSVSDVYLLNASTEDFIYSTLQSSTLDYHRQIYAAYLSFTFKFTKHFAIQSGARNEYTTATGNFSGSGKRTFSPYNILVPSVVFMYSFGKDQTVKLSYTRRLERPDYRDLDPFINASDPQNLITGNPNLKPEIGDRVELAYNRSIFGSGNFSASLYARINTHDIQPYWRFYPTFVIGDSSYQNVTVQVRENIGHEDNYGLDLFASVPVANRFDIRTNVMLFQRYIFSGISSIANVRGFNYRANVNATYRVNSNLAFEFFGNFRSPLVNAQGTRPGFVTYTLAFRKVFMHKHASIAATATNFLSEYVNVDTKLVGDNFTMNNLRKIPYRSFGINLTYKFGGYKKQKGLEDTNLNNPPEN